MTDSAEPHAPRVLMWDIEATNLNATMGTILCIGYKWLGQRKVRVIKITDGPHESMIDDRWVVSEFAKVFNSADFHSTWYGGRYDLPMVESKLIQNGLPPLLPKTHLDLWKTARYQFKLHSNRLAAWEEFLLLPEHKTPLKLETWRKAAIGDLKSLEYIYKHCAKDVAVLEKTYLKMRPWIKGLPDQGLVGDGHGCPACGSADYKRVGYKMTANRLYPQYQCSNCGRPFRGRKAMKVGEWAQG